MKGNFHKLLKTLRDKHSDFDLEQYEKDIYKRHKEWVKKEMVEGVLEISNNFLEMPYMFQKIQIHV